MNRAISKYILNFKYAVRPYKPVLTFRLVKNYLNILFLKKMLLRYVDFAIDYRCNLKCQHCFAAALIDDARPVITPSEYQKVVKEAMRLGAVNFSFQGGEATMFPALKEYIRAAFPKSNLISVTTNATLLNEKEIIDLKKAGVDILTISLDSGIPEEHDAFRGIPGTFDKAYNTIILAVKNGLKVTIGATISHQNIKSMGIIKLIELARRMNVILFFALAVPIGKWQGEDDVLLTAEDRKYLDELLEKYPFVRTDFDANYMHKGCGAVKEILYLTPYGDVLPCPFLHFCLGNVKKQSLNEIREKALRYSYFERYYNKCLAAEDREFIEKYIYNISKKDNIICDAEILSEARNE